MKVIILGAGNMLMNLIAGCLDAGCEIVGVFRYEKVRYPLIDRIFIDIFNPSKEYNYIKGHKLYEINARSANSAEFKKEVLRLNADIILVGTWSEKLKKNIIDLPKIATINVHPSLLPKYRGPNPYLHAILNNEKESGVTFHLMDEQLDTGAILLQKTVKIGLEDTGEDLRNKIAPLAREGVCELMQTLDREIIVPVAQDEKHASYFSQVTSDDTMLDFSEPAEQVCRHIRAFHPWLRCFFRHKNQFFIPDPHKLEILDSKSETKPWRIVDKSHKDNSITIACADGKLLKMSGLKLYGPLKYLTKWYIKYKVKFNSAS